MISKVFLNRCARQERTEPKTIKIPTREECMTSKNIELNKAKATNK